MNCSALIFAFAAASACAAPGISSFDSSGKLAWTNATTPGVCTVEATSNLPAQWTPLRNFYATNASGSCQVAIGATNRFFRVASVSVEGTSAGFTNFVNSYGRLETVAGWGAGRVDGASYWQTSYEGGPATAAALSRPHFAMADNAGNIYIADKNSHSILRVDTNGLIHTHAGTHASGFNGDGPALATTLKLNSPNALWTRADGVVYILDTGNARVRRVAANGIMSTLFFAQSDTNSALDGGRSLWVKDDESLAYFGNNTRIRKWTPSGGLKTLSSGFVELGGFCVLSSGSLIVADRGGNYVYAVTSDGSRTIIAGNGTTNAGTSGSYALSTAFYGPRTAWPAPTGGYLLLLHDGAQLWYIDSSNIARLLVNGANGNGMTHAGDGSFFYNPNQAEIGEGRSVTMDSAGDIILCESDYGFVRRINFLRLTP